MPFYYDGACAEHLRALGFEHVIHEEAADFFVKARAPGARGKTNVLLRRHRSARACLQVKDPKFMKKVDLIWDNPPYTSPETKERVLRALVATGKPFAMLLPISVLHVGFVRDIVDADQARARKLCRVKEQSERGDAQLSWVSCVACRCRRSSHAACTCARRARRRCRSSTCAGFAIAWASSATST
eukprot:3943329-Prymnesium_polylepis.1